MLDIVFLVFHDGFLISDIGFSILEIYMFLDFWILDLGILDFMYKNPISVVRPPAGAFFFWKNDIYPEKSACFVFVY